MKASLLDTYLSLLDTISKTAQAYDRDPQEIRLVTVTKNHEWPEISPLYNAGQRLFGENRLQPALSKIEQAPKECEWHFIGPLQKNKVRKVIAHFSLIHSVDTLELAKKISTCSVEASITTRILLQVNVSGEPSKQGMTPLECLNLSEHILMLPNVYVEGLMTMAPFTQDEALIRHCFSQLRVLRNELRKQYGSASFAHLSMGMSQDYQLAIAEGATLLRIGSAIFNGTN